MSIATALATGRTAHEELAREAVRMAMARAGLTQAGSVLLFLTADFAPDPQPALRAAARAAGCTQVVGCSCAGIFTEEEWVLDAPAAAAMVFGDGLALRPAPADAGEALILALAAPNALNSAWIHAPGRRFGGVSGDATGRGPFKVWCGGKVAAAGRCETVLSGARGAVGVSQGVRPLSRPLAITQVSGYDVISLASQPSLNVLARELPLEVRDLDRIPLHLIMAGVTFGDPDTAIEEGRYRLMPVISANSDDRSVTLPARLTPGERMFWALRQPLAAERDMRRTLDRVAAALDGPPRFGLFFPCMGRGPYFYGGIDRDLELVKGRFPGLPLIGFYGNGEIAPFQGGSELFQYSAVLGLFTTDV
jgi:small ligand-binding sensory domain FIST